LLGQKKNKISHGYFVFNRDLKNYDAKKNGSQTVGINPYGFSLMGIQN